MAWQAHAPRSGQAMVHEPHGVDFVGAVRLFDNDQGKMHV